jgi:hypothetical protein
MWDVEESGAARAARLCSDVDIAPSCSSSAYSKLGMVTGRKFDGKEDSGLRKEKVGRGKRIL